MKTHQIHLTDAQLDALPPEERELAWRLIRGQSSAADVPFSGLRLPTTFQPDPSVRAAEQHRADGTVRLDGLVSVPKRAINK